PPASAAPSSAVFSLGASAGGEGAAAGAAVMRDPGLAAPAAGGGFIADFASDFFLPKHIATGLISRRYDITGVLLGCLRRGQRRSPVRRSMPCVYRPRREEDVGMRGGGGGGKRGGREIGRERERE
ncbi:hypothetical protein PENTCL1PPCAC_10995, partial [Pristionchus entomophagus]